jgi:hypothetical protein
VKVLWRHQGLEHLPNAVQLAIARAGFESTTSSRAVGKSTSATCCGISFVDIVSPRKSFPADVGCATFCRRFVHEILASKFYDYGA